MPMDRLALPPPTERQLALPWEPVVGPPTLTGIGPAVLPAKVWRGLSPPVRARVHLAVLRVLQEVAHADDRP
jgi:hypothetical protein